MFRLCVPALALLLCACPAPIDVMLAPPADGFQLEVPPFEVSRGVETQRCFFFAVPSNVPAFVRRFEIAQNSGTHHMNVFRVRTRHGLDGNPGDVVVDGECWNSPNWADWPLVVNSQESSLGSPNPNDASRDGYTEWTLPDGVAMKLEPGELLMLQTHYVNASSQTTPRQARVFVNFHTTDPAKVQAEVGTAFATNQSIRVCPGDTNRFFETSCRISQDQPVTIIAANSHFHSRGKRFTISVFDPSGATTPAPFYESTHWDDPPMAWGLDIPIPANAGFTYRCEYSASPSSCGDPDDQCCFTFGGKVESQEHCNAFVYYYPKGAHDVGCF